MFGIPTRGLIGPNMCGVTRVFHPRDDWIRRRHAWYFNLRMIGPGMSVHVIGGLITYEILGAA